MTEGSNERRKSEPAQLQDLVLDSTDLERFLNRLAILTATTFTTEARDVFCSVTLLRPKSKDVIASSSDQAKNLDEVQLAYDDGPCLRAAREGQIYVVKDFTTEDRFGAYSAAIVGHGIRSALGIPIALEGHAAAGLNLYATAPDAFDPTVITAADTLGKEASQLLRRSTSLSSRSPTTTSPRP